MANTSYPSFRTGLQKGEFDLDNAVIKCALVTGGKVEGHTVMADLAANGQVMNGSPATLTNVTIVDGVFDADDVTITTTSSGSTHSVVVFQASAPTGGADLPANQQKLMWWFGEGTNLPITPGAGNVTITWPDTAGKIYRIG